MGGGVNYYERHLGDYARDAGHLTMLEHGAYTLLLDRYYTTEEGIPADQVYRICRARTPAEKAAVDTVLVDFFALQDGVWVNGRATREVCKMQAKVKAAQENGKRGGRPKQTRAEPNGNPVGSGWAPQKKAHQSPDTSHQTPESTSVLSASPTRAAEVCIALKAAGVSAVNPSHAGLRALLDAGAEVAEFVGMAEKAAGKSNGFAYVLAAVKGERERAKATAGTIHHGPLRVVNKQAAIEAENKRASSEWLAQQGAS